MSTEISKAQDAVTASTVMRPSNTDGAKAGGVFTVVCHDKDGNFKWQDNFHNLVVNEGLQDMNTKYFKGSAYTAAFYFGIIDGAGAGNTFAAGDTLASHAGWTENTAYSGNRVLVNFGTPTTADPSVITNSGSPSVFTMTSNGQTISGAFLTTVASGTSGVLFSANNFSGGDKSVDSGDTLSVTYSFSLDAA